MHASDEPRSTAKPKSALHYCKLLALAALMPMVVAACSGDSGYTQGEVDQLVAEAVSKAVDEAQDNFVSEAEAQAKAEAAAKQASLLAAVDGCGLSNSRYVTADEAGLVIQTEGEESSGIDYPELLCVLYGLDIPESVIQRMSKTNSQMGIVEGRWGVYEAEWTYHPDNGLNMFIVVAD